MPTRREEIVALLDKAEKPLTAQDICDALDVKDRDIIYEDIEHIARSAKQHGMQILIRPASCGKCGYVFEHRKSAKRPSKCPQCHSEWILLPAYLIHPRR